MNVVNTHIETLTDAVEHSRRALERLGVALRPDVDPLIHSLRAIRESPITHVWVVVQMYRARHRGRLPASLTLSHQLRFELVGDVGRHPDPWTGAYAINWSDEAHTLTWHGIPIYSEPVYHGVTANCWDREALLVDKRGEIELIHVRSFAPAIEVAVPTRIPLPLSAAVGLEGEALLYTLQVFRIAMRGDRVSVYKEHTSG